MSMNGYELAERCRPVLAVLMECDSRFDQGDRVRELFATLRLTELTRIQEAAAALSVAAGLAHAELIKKSEAPAHPCQSDQGTECLQTKIGEQFSCPEAECLRPSFEAWKTEKRHTEKLVVTVEGRVGKCRFLRDRPHPIMDECQDVFDVEQ